MTKQLQHRIVTDIRILTRHADARCRRGTCPWWVANAADDVRLDVRVAALHALIRWITDAFDARPDEWYYPGEHRALQAALRLQKVMPAVETFHAAIRAEFEHAA